MRANNLSFLIYHTRLIGRYEKPEITRQRFFDPNVLKTGSHEPSEGEASVERPQLLRLWVSYNGN